MAKQNSLSGLKVLSLLSVSMVLQSPSAHSQAPTSPQVQALGTVASLGLNSPPASLASPNVPSVTSVPEDFSKLKMKPGVLLAIQAVDEPNASGLFRVEEDGAVFVPLAGKLQVGGMTTEGVRDLVTQTLKNRQILKDPQVSVSIQQYAPLLVTVLGEVQRPGRIELLTSHPLQDVLAAVGGETQLAGRLVYVEHTVNGQREVETYQYKKNALDGKNPQLEIRSGDTITVPRAGIVYVLGGVLRPGGYLMQEDGQLNLAQALSLALGTVMQAKVSDIKIVRKDLNSQISQTVTVNYKDVMTGKMTAPILQAEDIVYVPISKLKTVFTTGGYALSAAATSTVYAVR